MAAQIVPVDSSPNQSFQAQLSVDGKTLTMRLRFRFNAMANYWTMAIDDANGEPMLECVPLVTGGWPAANVLSSYAYLEIGSAYVLNVGATYMDSPQQTNLGTDFILLWDDTPAQ